MTFSEYAQFGWALVPFSAGRKGPDWDGWSKEENCIKDSDTACGCESAGLAHAYSGTCSIDIDDLEAARPWLDARGIDIDALLKDPRAVKIVSGRENRAKLLYTLLDPLPTKQPCTGLELRCATRDGRTVQDVLPPSIHPDTGQPYKWEGDWRNLPPLPDELRSLWQALVDVGSSPSTPPGGRDTDTMRALLEHHDPDAEYHEWLRVGMALHHGADGSEEGLALWDEWSSQSEKYKGLGDLRLHWRSFAAEGEGLVTADYLRQGVVASPDDFEPLETPKEELERFALVQVAEWAQRPPPEWIIRGVLPESDLTMMFGEPGCGKSFMALDLTMAIASGRQWRGLPTAQGSVVWVAAEAAGSVRNRVRAYAEGYDEDLAELPFYIIGDTPDLNQLDHVKALAERMHPVAPSVIVLDTLAASSGGANENSGEDMGVILSACRALHKITGATILLIHHSGKDKARGARGWSGIKAAMQTELEIDVTDSGARVLRVVKQRDGEAGQALGFRLCAVPLDGEQVSCYVEHLTGRVDFVSEDTEPFEQRVLAAMPFGGAGQYEVVRATAAVGISPPLEPDEDSRAERVDLAIAELLSDGKLELDGGVLSVIGAAGGEFDA